MGLGEGNAVSFAMGRGVYTIQILKQMLYHKIRGKVFLPFRGDLI